MRDQGERRVLIAAALLIALAVVGFVARNAVRSAWEWVTDDAVGTVEGWLTRMQDYADQVPEREVEARAVVADSRSALIVIGSGPETSAFALAAVAPEGEATFTLIPQRMLAMVPGFGEFRLDQALSFEDAELAMLTVVNEFGIRVDDVVALDPGELAAALVAPVVVDLPVGLFVRDGEGTQRVVAAGEQSIDPEVVEALLTTQGAGDGFEWLQRQGAVWRAILDRVAVDPGLADRMTAATPRAAIAADLILTVAANGQRRLATIPVESTSAGDGETVFVPSTSAGGFVGERLRHLLLRVDRPAVEVLNGTGRIGATRVVAGNLVRLGYRVIRTDNADSFDYEETEVIAQGRKGEVAAREALEALGTGTLLLELRAPSTVIDVSIIVGRDIPAGEG